MTYKTMSYISGIIIFFGIVIFFGTILWLSGERIISTKEYKLYFKFADVVGLKDKSPVYMRGYRVGWSKDVKFEKNDVVVRVDIKQKYRVPIDSKVEIITLNLMGEKAITIIPGSSDEYFKSNTVIIGENNDLMNIAKNILTTIKEKMEQGDLDKVAKELSETVSLSHALVQKISRKTDQVDIDSYNRQIMEIGQAAKSLHALSSAGDTSLQNINHSLALADSLSAELTVLTKRLNNGEGTAGELLRDKSYIQNLDSTITELKILITDFKAHPEKYIHVSVF
jgi:phospholipid/cholesterol/gamma-HCH transport system substrate-binding protein